MREAPVVIAYDGSDEAKAAIEKAGANLALPRHAIVLTVRVNIEAIPFWGAPITALPPEIAESAIRHAEATAAEGAELAQAAGFETEALVDVGDPVWHRIVDVADEREADLIVIGSHGRGGVSRALLGSVATAVAHHANQPVFIARP